MSTREKLIDGTAQAALENGLRGMTVADILARASLSRRTFYQHFSNKEEAVGALYDQVVGDLVEDIERAVNETEDPTQRLFAGLEAYLRFQLEGGNLIALLQAEAANPASMLSPARERALDRLVRLVDRDVREVLGEALDPLIYRCLYLGLEGLVIRVRRGGELTRENHDRVSTIIKHLFVRTLAASASMPHVDQA